MTEIKLFPWTNLHEECITLRLEQNGRHFADNISKYKFWDENIWIMNKILLKFLGI